MTRVIIAEDQSMGLGALAALLGIERDIQVVGVAANGSEALTLVDHESPDVLLTDIEMPEFTGLEVAAEIERRRVPTRVVISGVVPDAHQDRSSVLVLVRPGGPNAQALRALAVGHAENQSDEPAHVPGHDVAEAMNAEVDADDRPRCDADLSTSRDMSELETDAAFRMSVRVVKVYLSGHHRSDDAAPAP